ncbi:glycosyltransferase family 2 protein [Litorivivens sp.]|uniref:glycosyltransferase family 2 protein n=2 Tax=Litorivivens sp. TaxID=2020868 RepID=UPI00356A4564
MPLENNNKPLVTVVISAYNHAAFVSSCVHSALRQTYPNIEVLTYDDGSSDTTADILNALSDQHGFAFTAQANRGLSKTLNHALGVAKGKYFCPVGSDDIMMLDKTEKQVAFMEANPGVAVCGGNSLLIDEKGELCSKRQRFHPARDLTFSDLFENTTPGFISPTAMIRTDVLKAAGGYREDIPLEDLYLWLKLASLGHRIHAINDVLLYYRKHPNNTYKNVGYMFHSIHNTLSEYQQYPSYNKVLKRHKNSLLLSAAKQGDKQGARDILQSLSYRDINLKTLRALTRLYLKIN